MRINVEHKKSVLLGQLRKELRRYPEDRAILSPFLDAIADKRSHFALEPWHDVKKGHHATIKTIRGEFLLRAQTADGQNISPETLSKGLTNPRVAYLFDKLVILMAVDQAVKKNQFPISVNISAHHASERSNLIEFHQMLRQHFGDSLLPQRLTFEFLENDPAENPRVGVIRTMQGHGYKFAIDDLSHEDADARRLENLGPLVDFVKIDGKTMCGYKAGQVDLEAFFDRVTQHAPQAHIVCEFVDSPQEAWDLMRKFPQIHFVQGRYLPAKHVDFSRDFHDVAPVPVSHADLTPEPVSTAQQKPVWVQPQFSNVL